MIRKLLQGSNVLKSTQFEKDFSSIIKTNAEKLKKKSGSYSVSIGIIKDGKQYTQHFGEIDKNKGNTATDSTYFEVASITKLFTGYLLAEAVLEKKINLEDDIRTYLTDSYPNFEYNGRPIKVKNLISYESALPANLPDETALVKSISEKVPFLLSQQDSAYSKQKFFRDLHTIKLDIFHTCNDCSIKRSLYDRKPELIFFKSWLNLSK